MTSDSVNIVKIDHYSLQQFDYSTLQCFIDWRPLETELEGWTLRAHGKRLVMRVDPKILHQIVCPLDRGVHEMETLLIGQVGVEAVLSKGKIYPREPRPDHCSQLSSSLGRHALAVVFNLVGSRPQ